MITTAARRNVALPNLYRADRATDGAATDTALDALVEAGVLPRERGPGALFPDLIASARPAVLLIDRTLRSLDHAPTHDIGHRLPDMVPPG